MGKWTNADGLHVRFGLTEGEYAKQAALAVAPTQWRMLSLKIGENISSTSATQLAGGRLDAETPLIIEKGSLILRAYFITDVAFDSGGSATLDLGISVKAGTYSGADEDYIAVAITEASIDTAGKIVDLHRLPGASGFGGAGIVSGDADGLMAANAADLYFSFDVDTAAFTVGEGRLLLEVLPPTASGPTTYGANQ